MPIGGDKALADTAEAASTPRYDANADIDMARNRLQTRYKRFLSRAGFLAHFAANASRTPLRAMLFIYCRITLRSLTAAAGFITFRGALEFMAVPRFRAEADARNDADFRWLGET